ncbi:dual specificity protein phosphatase 1B [Selaginella moellendorffii]|nr:dual specificity protein phosphatase 1B [Selaginella moellendorffii]|eukprot:XP_002960839.2 dual specificity protein phosphatase 1B [Selaginella moellendorffii]
MKQVRERLYISNADDAGIYLCGIMQGFTHVLSLAPVCLHPQCNFIDTVPPHRLRKFQAVESKLEKLCPAMVGKPPVRKIVPLLDKEDQDILPVLQECLEFIDEGIEQGMVLVHCVGGRSRSASVVIAYLMWKEGCSFDEALESLLACRKCVRPNDGFIKQLQEFESTLRGERELGSRKVSRRDLEEELTCRLCNKTFMG